MARHERSAGSYAQYRPSYPDQLIGHLTGLIAAVPAGMGTVLDRLDIGAGTGIFSRQLRDALPASTRLIAVEPGAAMRAQAIVATRADTAEGSDVR
jgi:hypothetical protein